MTGEVGEMADEAARFATRLRKELGIEVELVDERLTSWEAGQMMAETDSARQPKESSLDDVAAAIFLREYLERLRGRLQPLDGGEGLTRDATPRPSGSSGDCCNRRRRRLARFANQPAVSRSSP